MSYRAVANLTLFVKISSLNLPQDCDRAVHRGPVQDRRLLHPRLQLRRQQEQHRKVRLQLRPGRLQREQGEKLQLLFFQMQRVLVSDGI